MIWFVCSKDHIPDKDKMIRVECTVNEDPYHFTGYVKEVEVLWETKLMMQVTNELTGSYEDKHDNAMIWNNLCEDANGVSTGAQWRYVTDNEKMAFL